MMLRKAQIFAFIIVILLLITSNHTFSQLSAQSRNIAKAGANSAKNQDRADIKNQDETPVYKNPAYSIDQRMEDLIETIEEKM